jgi:hypothetical protein
MDQQDLLEIVENKEFEVLQGLKECEEHQVTRGLMVMWVQLDL